MLKVVYHKNVQSPFRASGSCFCFLNVGNMSDTSFGFWFGETFFVIFIGAGAPLKNRHMLQIVTFFMQKLKKARKLVQNVAKCCNFFYLHPNAGWGFYSQKNTFSEVEIFLQIQKGIKSVFFLEIKPSTSFCILENTFFC